MSPTAERADPEEDLPPARRELIRLVRASSGGLLLGVPLLYTMEVWWIGSHTHPRQVLTLLVLLTLPVFVLNKTAGFRSRRDVTFADAAGDTVEAIAVGVVVTALVLVLLREITTATPLAVALGKVAYESVPFCLGTAVARHFLRGSRTDEDDDDGEGDGDQRAGTATLADLGAATIGAVFVALSIAPTDEVPLITSAMTPAYLLLLIGASLLASYAIVFTAGFTDQDSRHEQAGPAQRPAAETIVCYLVGLVVALVLLWIFQRDPDPVADLFNRAIVLAFPAAIGGAAGRIVA